MNFKQSVPLFEAGERDGWWGVMKQTQAYVCREVTSNLSLVFGAILNVLQSSMQFMFTCHTYQDDRSKHNK